MRTFKAVAYARYSSDKQQESSIIVQLAAIHRFCEDHNIELVAEYVDEAQTGTNANRKSFQEMISEAPKKEFQLVIVHRLDRWARNVDDARYYKRYLQRYGIKIISAIEEFDESPEGEFFELMSLGMAELYSKKLSRESMAGKLANAKEAKAHGGSPPLGYMVKNKKYVINDEEVESVRIIFDMFVEGYSYSEIRDYLNENGFRRSDGRLFTKHFYDILRNRKYLGEYIYNRSASKDSEGKRNNHANKGESEIIRIVGGMPQIIDFETFSKAQRILDSKMHNHNGQSHLKKPRKYLLTGLIQCKICGHSCFGASTKGRHRMLYRYHCDKQALEHCSNKGIYVDYLNEYIENLIYKTLLNPAYRESLKILAKESYIRALDKLYERKINIDREIEETREYITKCAKESIDDTAKIIKHCLDGEIADASFRIKQLEQEKEYVDFDILKYPKIDLRQVDLNANRIRKIIENGTFEEKQKAIRKLLDRIYMGNDTIDVRVNIGELLNIPLHIGFTIIQDRDKIANLKQLQYLDYKFENLTVKMK